MERKDEKMKIAKLFNLFLIAFVITYGVLAFYISTTDLQLGDRIGSGIFYMKGYYETSEVIGGVTRTVTVTENGPGMYVIPLLVGLISALVGWFVARSREHA
jgi:hypothetical protein